MADGRQKTAVTFKTRALITLSAAALVPLAFLATGVRSQLRARLVADYERRLDAVARVAREDLARESAAIAKRLSAVARAMPDDEQFRTAVLRADPEARRYLLDYAGHAMELTGLAMLQIQDSAGRILSSGHFRNEFDRPDAATLRLVASARDTALLLAVRTPEAPLLALVRADSLRLSGRRFYLVGGVAADELQARVRRGDSTRVDVAWDLRDSVVPPEGAAFRVVNLRYANDTTLKPARLVLTQSRAELAGLERELNRWLIGAVGTAVIGVAVLAVWFARSLSQPMADLAQATTRIDLDGALVPLPVEREDEVGTVARRLDALATRLRASAGKLRAAERRATVGDMARQVNHDIKNGLIPIRNVLRHLGDVSERDPASLPGAFGDRRRTLDASVEYLDTLARNYAKLTPRVVHEPVDVNAVIRDAVVSASASSDGIVQLKLTEQLPPVHGDRVIVRRILDNLVRNAIESLDERGGRVTVTSARSPEGIIVTVSDTGRGMTAEELAHAFDDFFTTKADGTGLGLSVVRRLTSDLSGNIRVESAPGRGTTFTLDLPA
ncbi:MAG TPA: HAMP domain-containing sensor histidine kinase [Gemmatimonadaceae bacterium]|nr:HAMP domain-containing sensor histidine kinase [Gemmatimonadaceae bacterium]